MEKRYYTVETLEAEIRTYEEQHPGITTEQVVAAHSKHERVPGVSGFDTFVWADTFEEIQRLRERLNS